MTRIQELQTKMNEAQALLSECSSEAVKLRVDIMNRLLGKTEDEAVAGYGPSDADYFLTRFVAAQAALSRYP